MAFRILVIWETFPRPDFNAGDRRLVALIELLARQHHVDYATPLPVTGPRTTGRDALTRAGVSRIAVGWSAFAMALMRRRYDIVLFEFYSSFVAHGSYVREQQPTAVLLIDSVDVNFAREEAGALARATSPADEGQARALEVTAYRSCDGVIVVSDAEAQLLRDEGGMPPLFVIPIIIEPRRRERHARGEEVLFIGGFSHQPNVDSVLWFASHVWPRVYEAMPSALFTIVGSNPPAEVEALAAHQGIRVRGYVQDTGSIIDMASVSVAPLRYGAGMKGKVVEALACGLPLVTTSSGVQGIPVTSGVHAMVADTSEDFATGVLTLLQQPEVAWSMAMAGQELARAYAPETVAVRLVSMLTKLVPRQSRVKATLRWACANARVVVKRLQRAIASR